MKLHNKLSIGLIIALTILIVTIGLVNAQPIPIGKTTWQEDPFDSNPTAYSESGTYSIDAAKVYDGRLTTMGYFTLAEDWADGWIEWSGFKSSPSTFTIGWVDIKIKYSVDPYGIDDTHRIEYSIDGSTWTVLQPDTTDPFDVDDTPGDAQIRSWAEVSRPGGGDWTWTDISNLRVRVYHTPGADWYCDYNTMWIYEIWATVYKPPLPPAASTAISIQPLQVETLPAGRRWFFEVYAQDVTALAGYQLTINFNSTVLSPITGGYWSYYPFYIDVSGIDDVTGYVSIGASILVADPLFSTGVTGNFSLARIYLTVDPYMAAADYSYLAFSVSVAGDPTGSPIPHGEYHGLYGAPPPEERLVGWTPTSTFPYNNPTTTEWVEQWPNPGQIWHLTSHEENQVEPLPDGELNPSDQVDMLMVEPPGTDVWWWHVDEIWESDVDGDAVGDNVYMILTFKYKEPTPEFPLGLGLMMILALLIPTAYLWRLRRRR